MKAILVFCLCMLITITCQSQANKRIPLVEHFTNTYCVICASRNPPLYEVMNKYGKDINHISYFPSVPYNQCPLYNYNREGNGARESFYQIPATPRLYVDGEESSNSPNNFDADINDRKAISSPIGIEVIEVDAGRIKTARVEILGAADSKEGDYRLFVALVERKLEFAANNGETEHFNVFRQMMSSNTGTPISLPARGESLVMEFNASVPEDLNLNEMYVLAYVQEPSSGTVLNSGSRFSQSTTAVFDEKNTTLEVYPNPARGEVTIMSNHAIHRVTIVDVLGREVKRKDAHLLQSSMQLETQNLSEGLYWLGVYYVNGETRIKPLQIAP